MKAAVFLVILVQIFCSISLGQKRVQSGEIFDFVGRFAETADHTFQATWPNSAVRFNIQAQNSTASIVVTFNNCYENCKYFVQTHVDCNAIQKYEINANLNSLVFDLATNENQIYEIELHKLTESSNGNAQGAMEVGEVTLNNAIFVPSAKALQLRETKNPSKLKTSCLRRHKLLVIGDSITAAYGVDGPSPCSFDASTENVEHSYATLVAAAVQAELHVIAWSGRGVVRNYGDASQMSAEPMPALYNRTLATQVVSSDPQDGNYWPPASYPADIVLVMLGTNDYSTQPQPSDEQFTNGLVDLLHQVLTDYPQAKGRVAAMCAPMQTGPQCANIQQAAATAGVEYVFIDPAAMSGGYGCDGHPNQASEQNIANVVIPVVESMLQQQV